MNRLFLDQDIKPLSEFRETLSDIRAAEEQLRQGRGVEHSAAKKRILKSLRKSRRAIIASPSGKAPSSS